MIKISTLKKLLNINEAEIRKLEIDQLRLLLGIFRYLTRVFQREVNERTHHDIPIHF